MLFALGAVVATPCALRHCLKSNVDAMSLIHRHSNGDWGDVNVADAKANTDALAYDGRVFSVYVIRDVKLYVITEWDRSVTTLLCASDY